METGNESPASGADQNLFEVGVSASPEGPSTRTPKRKRGRPKKSEVGAGARVPVLLPEPSASASEPPPPKGERGRPKGSGELRLPVPSTAGDALSFLSVKRFDTYIQTVLIGQDIIENILAYTLQGRRAVSILAATGVVSTLVIYQLSESSTVSRYEGYFEILSLSGTYGIGNSIRERRKNGKLSLSVAKPDGQVFGGAVAGPLIAGGPVQLVVACFKPRAKKQARVKKYELECPAAEGPNREILRLPAPAHVNKDSADRN